MGRIANTAEAQREQVEGDLACLGNAIVLLQLVDERIRVAARLGNQQMLLPAIDDLQRIRNLIARVQSRIGKRG